MMDDRARLLVEILLNHDARADERDDAASYLGRIAEESVVRALAVVASSAEEDEVPVTCMEGEFDGSFEDREALRFGVGPA
jgi:hypothetical protein